MSEQLLETHLVFLVDPLYFLAGGEMNGCKWCHQFKSSKLDKYVMDSELTSCNIFVDVMSHSYWSE